MSNLDHKIIVVYDDEIDGSFDTVLELCAHYRMLGWSSDEIVDLLEGKRTDYIIRWPIISNGADRLDEFLYNAVRDCVLYTLVYYDDICSIYNELTRSVDDTVLLQTVRNLCVNWCCVKKLYRDVCTNLIEIGTHRVDTFLPDCICKSVYRLHAHRLGNKSCPTIERLNVVDICCSVLKETLRLRKTWLRDPNTDDVYVFLLRDTWVMSFTRGRQFVPVFQGTTRSVSRKWFIPYFLSVESAIAWLMRAFFGIRQVTSAYTVAKMVLLSYPNVLCQKESRL